MGYRERRLARAERLRGWAEKRQAKSAAAFKAAKRVADGIPMGQPILVGHHSEKHHRRDIDRIHNNMSKGVEHQAMASSMDSRADEIERQADHAIYDDDVDAVERLTEKLAGLEARRERIKTENAAFRKTHRAELAAKEGVYERDLMMPHQAYVLQNLGGNITRARQRLARLSGGSSRAPAAALEGTTATARAGLVITASMTTPSRAGKQPRPVWNVTGNIGPARAMLLGLDGSWYRSAFSFWDDPTEAIEAACLAAEEKPDGGH
jgi:hypothetical protein